MKRKIIKLNKSKMTFWVKNIFWYKVVHQNRIFTQQSKLRHKYVEVLDYDNAFRMFEGCNVIFVPIIVSSKVKRSRVKNKVNAYLHVNNITKFNEMSGLNKSIDDINVGELDKTTGLNQSIDDINVGKNESL
ncbi:hypothetical protein [Yersinia phage fHe-Yen9-04]|uniref:Uncharacterized protein n=1 Tax=Yersinia phage fHe-Yen9-04 TaxID=2052742 RepID=A0A2C9CYM4_9CAUD|nr:hypothetical protein FDJ41_gp171 [Yersinia phage fHe-Yen9-04]SOK58448.1 hypothetical protein [Yersinia phage fHe-Yen9-04]VUE36217.1 hypothetical protein [Yersinia phage fHe-Yen9-04]